jgi:hypothetical protein
MLNAEVAKIDKDGTEEKPLGYRVGQIFDELDDPGSKKNHFWDSSFDWDKLQNEQYGNYQLKPFTICGFKLAASFQDGEKRNIPPAPGFAYFEGRYERMRDESGADRLDSDPLNW